MPRYIDVEKVELKGVAVFDENLEVLVPLSAVRKALQMTPTADVVPKREVEKIFEEIEASLYYKMVNGEVTLMIRESDYHELKKKYTEKTE